MRPASRVAVAVAPDANRLPSGLLQGLVLTGARRRNTRGGAGLVFSLSLHSALMATIVVVPLFCDAAPPRDVLKGFFPTPLELAPAPPPLPPPGKVVRVPRIVQTRALVAPIDFSSQIRPEETLDLADERAANVPGWEPGKVIGLVLTPVPVPTPPPQMIRIGGGIAPPKLVHRVDPEYPGPAQAAGISGMVILEAEVDADGRVTATRILRSHRLFDDAATAAVRQWRYQSLLLNGEPTAFVLTVTVNFTVPRR
jgi:TonB family protein